MRHSSLHAANVAEDADVAEGAKHLSESAGLRQATTTLRSSVLELGLRSVIGEHDALVTVRAELECLVQRAVAQQPQSFTAADAVLSINENEFGAYGMSPLEAVDQFLSDQLGESMSTLHLRKNAVDLVGLSASGMSGMSSPTATGSDVNVTLLQLSKIAKNTRVIVDLDLFGVGIDHPWYRGYVDGDARYAGFFVCESTRPELQYRNPEVIIAITRVLLACSDAGIRMFRIKAPTKSVRNANANRRNAVQKLLQTLITDSPINGVFLCDESNGRNVDGKRIIDFYAAVEHSMHLHDPTSLSLVLQRHNHVDNSAFLSLAPVAFDNTHVIEHGDDASEKSLDRAFLPTAIAMFAKGVPIFELSHVLGKRRAPVSCANTLRLLNETEESLRNPWSVESRMFERFFDALMLRSRLHACDPDAAQTSVSLAPHVFGLLRSPHPTSETSIASTHGQFATRSILFAANLDNSTAECFLPVGCWHDVVTQHRFSGTMPLRPYGFAVLEAR